MTVDVRQHCLEQILKIFSENLVEAPVFFICSAGHEKDYYIHINQYCVVFVTSGLAEHW